MAPRRPTLARYQLRDVLIKDKAMKISATKPLIIMLGGLSIVLLLVLWLASVGFIDVTVKGKPAGSLTYTVIDRAGNQVSQTKTISDHFHKRLKKGAYQIRIVASEQSSIQVSSVGGFFRTTKINTPLQPEKSREFVGNNPNFCMFYGQGLLYSYNCSELGGLTAHLPANSSTPTTNTSEADAPFILINGIVSLNGINKALVIDDEGGGVGLYDIDQELRQTNPVMLTGVSATDAANIANYKSGFVLYPNNLTSLKYFASPSSSPSTITAAKPNPGVTNPVGLSVLGESIGALFNNGTGGSDQAGPTSGKSEFVYYGSGAKRSYSFSKLYTSGGLCGHDELCLINSSLLDVYDVSQKKPNYIFSIKNVQKAFYVNKTLLIATNDDVIGLDPQSLTGTVQFSYGGSQYCGLNASGDGYVICLMNNKGKKVALHIDPSQNNTDSIDKKVLELLKDPNIDDVSAYKNYIYILPNLGQLKYFSAINGYDYDPAIKQTAAAHIDKLVQTLNIDTTRYMVINPQR